MPKNIAPQQIPGWGLYLAAVGAAGATTFFDRVRNGEVSALRKTGIALREMVESSDFTSNNASMLALLIFGLVAALMVFVYRPREQKEAFMLGLSVLAAMGMVITPPQQTSLNASGVKSSTAAITPAAAPQHGFSWIASAHAQTQTQTQTQDRAPEAPAANLWVFLDGPRKLQPNETRVLVFSPQTRKTVVNAPATPAFQLALPPGKYQFEVSHLGYRSTVFNLDVAAGTQAVQLRMEPVNMELLNFFGPAKGRPKVKPEWAVKLDSATRLCGEAHDKAQANQVMKGLDKRWLDNLSDEGRRALCLS